MEHEVSGHHERNGIRNQGHRVMKPQNGEHDQIEHGGPPHVPGVGVRDRPEVQADDLQNHIDRHIFADVQDLLPLVVGKIGQEQQGGSGKGNASIQKARHFFTEIKIAYIPPQVKGAVIHQYVVHGAGQRDEKHRGVIVFPMLPVTPKPCGKDGPEDECNMHDFQLP